MTNPYEETCYAPLPWRLSYAPVEDNLNFNMIVHMNSLLSLLQQNMISSTKTSIA